MHAHDGADVARQVSPARRARYVLGRVQAVRIDHEVAIRQVYLRGLGLVLAVEELGQGSLLHRVYRVVVEPRRVARNDDVMGLLGHIVFDPVVFRRELL